MEPWFKPLPGSNEGYHGLGMHFGVMPASWEGWLATLIYLALQVCAILVIGLAVDSFGGIGSLMLLVVFLLHLAYLGFASRHLPLGSDAQAEDLRQ